ncbi:uncharacterized protein LOC62_02G002970 [Vanrija pseudolonga]|uniref:Uncharacterized protein n=1 Tax=Vanrija pseudolonga TaxID=143232 RepID=A0AAF0Y7E5_9TREE|nr:hypothetical protein LOC62_02G002970 [Vanrija pseudolonga]
MAFSLPAPLPAPIARSRLKSNLGALALFAFLRAIFTPYISLRAVLVALVDKVLALASLQRRGSAMVWWIETLVTLSLLYNIAEAAYWVQQPPVPPPAPKGMAFVPISKSSPLTRSYPEPAATPVRSSAAQSPLAQSIYRASPNRPGAVGSPAVGTPERQSPLSSSTARILNLAQPAPSATGLFYDDTSSASPSKVARGGLGASTSSVTAAPATTSTTSRSDFVVVERDEKEWVDNVWKGVRGKGRHIGL